jgi:hypothetical protein
MVLTDLRRLRPILGGMKQFVFGYSPEGETVGANANARYCYSVWMRHLAAWRRAGMAGPIRVAAELGPGNSLGTGIAALLSGVDHYYALDVANYSDTRVELVDAIAELYRRRADIPGPTEFPELSPKLDSYEFPHDIFANSDLDASLTPERLGQVRNAIAQPGTRQGEILVRYFAPWHESSVIQPASVDVAFSQAVMEHVNDIEPTYRALSSWVREGGYMSHQIDFRSHGLATDWNGHWSYGDWLFRIARGRRPYLLNRQPMSAHVEAIRNSEFEILNLIPIRKGKGITRDQLAPGFRGMSDEDLSTSGLFVVARKVAKELSPSSA